MAPVKKPKVAAVDEKMMKRKKKKACEAKKPKVEESNYKKEEVEPLGGAVLQQVTIPARHSSSFLVIPRHSSSFLVIPPSPTQIFSALNLSSSHYAQCAGGHIYAIGDCGAPRYLPS